MRKVERLGSGRYKVRFRHGTSPKTGKPKQTDELFEAEREAVQFAKWLDALGPEGALDMLYAGQQAAAMPTLDQVAAEHIAHLTGIEDGTRLSYTRLWSRTWGPLIGRLPMSHVTRDAVAVAVNRLGQVYSYKSLQNQRGLLAAVCQRAVEDRLLAANPARGVRLPRGNEQERVEMTILTPEQFADLEVRIAGHYRPFARFLVGTGARWGEAVALQVGDVALPNVRIRRALKWSPDANRKVGPTKTRRSNRTVTVAGVVAADLEAACAGKSSGELVFTTITGRPIAHRNFWSDIWRPAVTDMSPRPRIHDLRHTHASWLLAAGVPIHVVQARLGHESITTTVDTYSHLLPDAQIAAAAAAALALGDWRALD